MVRRLRLASGLVLFTFVATHLLNHSLGLISLEAMEAGRVWFIAVWRSLPGTAVFYTALAGHFVLGLWALFVRRNLRMRPSEIAQLLLGLAIPFLLFTHVVGTRLANALFDTTDNYLYVLLIHWKLDTSNIALQIAATLVAWTHGSIGLHFWLRLKRWYGAAFPYLYAGFLLIPVLALLGYAEAGRKVAELAASRSWTREQIAALGFPSNAQIRDVLGLIDGARDALIVAVVGIVIARVVRSLIERRRGVVRVTYPNGRTVSSPPGATILEISRRGRVPHASVCGGRGRCSTCRVRVTNGMAGLPDASAEEQRVLDRIGNPINVRLACQTRPDADIAIIPLLPPDATPKDAQHSDAGLQGQERDVVVLFADLRAFTRFSERKLPYDVVFVLNRYFAGMGEAIELAGGRLDKFIGDGVMALFGLDTDLTTACRQALVAARTMADRLADLNRSLEHDLDEPLRIGIGIHAGPAIVGEMGYGPALGITAVGDTVNTASRLETATKEFAAQLVLSETVAQVAGVDLSAFPRHDIALRGRSETIAARVIERAETLPIGTAAR